MLKDFVMYDATYDYEVWMDIPEYIGTYQASDMGRVRSLHRLVDNAVREGHRLPKLVLKPGHNAAGRLQVVLCSGGVTRRYQVHRLVYEAFHGFIWGGAYVLHKDGDHLNNHISNLYLGSQLQNMADKKAHGSQVFGRSHPNAKLNDDAVRRIRFGGECQVILAKEYGVSQPCIANIRASRTWKHIVDKDTTDLFGQ